MGGTCDILLGEHPILLLFKPLSQRSITDISRMDLIGKLKFAEQDPKWAEEKAFYLSYQPPPGSPDTNVVYEAVDLLIHDIRPFKDSLSITREGYQIVDLESKLNYEDFFDRNRVQDVFLPELRTVLMELFGARGIYFHETVVRFSNIASWTKRNQIRSVQDIHNSRVIKQSQATSMNSQFQRPILVSFLSKCIEFRLKGIDYSLDQLRRLLEDVSGTTIPSGTRIQAVKYVPSLPHNEDRILQTEQISVSGSL